jgi:hypothetical protein
MRRLGERADRRQGKERRGHDVFDDFIYSNYLFPFVHEQCKSSFRQCRKKNLMFGSLICSSTEWCNIENDSRN